MKEKIPLEEFIKAYQNGSDKERKHRTYYLSDKTVTGINLLRRIYSEIYTRQTGIDRPIPANRVIGMAVENLIDNTLARIREEAGKMETS